MITKSITYTNFNGEPCTETFYFHLNKAELTKLEFKYKEGLHQAMINAIKNDDKGELIKILDLFISASYGVRSEDGKRFIKSAEKTEEFMGSEAYSELFMELASNEGAFDAFFRGVFPAGVMEEAEKLENKQAIAELIK